MLNGPQNSKKDDLNVSFIFAKASLLFMTHVKYRLNY